MGRIKLIGLFAGSIFSICFGQNDSCGIYLSANDFICGKLSFAYYPNQKGSYINSNNIFYDRYVIVKTKENKFKIPKDSIYAIKYPEGTITRMYHRDEYQILNAGEPILLYSKTSGPGNKGETATTTYYFTFSPGSELVILTLVNIELIFADHNEFLREVTRIFSSDEELLQYDVVAKMRLINLIYFQTSQKNNN